MRRVLIFSKNDKCMSCDRMLDSEKPKKEEKINKTKFLFKELYKNAPKFGSGYSRMLETLENPEDMNMLAKGGNTRNNQSIYAPTVDIDQNTNHMSGVMRNGRRNKSITNRPIPKVNLSDANLFPSIKSSLNTNSMINIDERKAKRKTNRNKTIQSINKNSERYQKQL
mmetsp:Transcript_27645/g.24481  ORF Transcript_27645/g.24481 Transcript_27645/m.24481 type:complete len:168 (+) Transcript_27645:54-557(+)